MARRKISFTSLRFKDTIPAHGYYIIFVIQDQILQDRLSGELTRHTLSLEVEGEDRQWLCKNWLVSKKVSLRNLAQFDHRGLANLKRHLPERNSNSEK